MSIHSLHLRNQKFDSPAIAGIVAHSSVSKHLMTEIRLRLNVQTETAQLCVKGYLHLIAFSCLLHQFQVPILIVGQVLKAYSVSVDRVFYLARRLLNVALLLFMGVGMEGRSREKVRVRAIRSLVDGGRPLGKEKGPV